MNSKLESKFSLHCFINISILNDFLNWVFVAKSFANIFISSLQMRLGEAEVEQTNSINYERESQQWKKHDGKKMIYCLRVLFALFHVFPNAEKLLA